MEGDEFSVFGFLFTYLFMFVHLSESPLKEKEKPP